MRYFKVKKVVVPPPEDTTLSLVHSPEEKAIAYSEIDGYQYFGVDTQDANFLAKQHAACAVEELTFAQIKSILDPCRMMKDFNTIIENQIAETYSFGRELKMRDLPVTNPERMEYEAFKELVKIPIRAKKVEFGLILAS